MTEGQKMLRAVLDRSRALAERWESNTGSISEETLTTELVRRWSANDAGVEPRGLEAFPEFENWYDALELYLLSECASSPLTDVLVKAHLRAYDELRGSSQAASLLELGDLWFFDITALTRYRGGMVAEVLGLLKDAATNAAEAIPHTDDESLKFFSDIYLRAAEVFVIDVSERDLKNTATQLGLARLPFEAYSILRDAFVPDREINFPNQEETEERFLLLFDVCITFFRKLQLFYSDQSNPRAPHCFRFDRWSSRFDYPTLLFAGALPWEFSDEAERLIADILSNAQRERRHVLRNGWRPTAIRMRDKLTDHWQLNLRNTDAPAQHGARHPSHDELREKAEAEERLKEIFEAA